MKNNKKVIFLIIGLGLLIIILPLMIIALLILPVGRSAISELSSGGVKSTSLEIKDKVNDYYNKKNELPSISEIMTKNQKKPFDRINFKLIDGNNNAVSKKIENIRSNDCNDGYGVGCSELNTNVYENNSPASISLNLELYTCSWGINEPNKWFCNYEH